MQTKCTFNSKETNMQLYAGLSFLLNLFQTRTLSLRNSGTSSMPLYVRHFIKHFGAFNGLFHLICLRTMPLTQWCRHGGLTLETQPLGGRRRWGQFALCSDCCCSSDYKESTCLQTNRQTWKCKTGNESMCKRPMIYFLLPREVRHFWFACLEY